MDEIINATESRYCLFVKILDDAECEEIPEHFTLITNGGHFEFLLTKIVITESFDDPDCGKCV